MILMEINLFYYKLESQYNHSLFTFTDCNINSLIYLCEIYLFFIIDGYLITGILLNKIWT